MSETESGSETNEFESEAKIDATSTPDVSVEYPLQVDGLRKTFGGITAVDDATFQIENGTLTGLIGPNGAGKSTTFNLITGMLKPDKGTVTFNGEDITGMEPHAIANKGLVRTFQIARELEDMTVLENMMLAPKNQRGEKLWRSVTPGVRNDVIEQEEELLERVWEVLEFFEIDHIAEEYAGNLSGGQRKLLEMARALLTDPDMLLLDEPFAGVNPSLEKRLLTHIHELREQGYTFLLVEHDMDLIMENCEHVIVLHQGRVLTEGTPADIKSNEEVIEAYLGGNV
ncbi:ABC transporter ATP-binding protein [Halogeometricum borinquense]|uniref:Probable branched-chain amino acid transport ATP-binding protein LivG n=2 Tax=Halogeometricum borinquense TaxID=60847 RepID=E4NRS1_HALBP|nr:ABC transporter ATP-binding protein [Halogeometricum borinquense]ADQ66858.1 amino acid/amide ABC transporter ATP-binding protein 1, HAAT family [Halogeometricum borinquense DSM 11551]ELY30366.1 amino acid/amide ABC transporter ATP-binding protein 1, haat family [Halogeometricum borinquense DSM 11551]QIB74828.1 ABC transporter ATP-binding protein [Halogeometricum borinquense]QIQ76174.1 ABC transporter ATP-binding protein [Halogeometricum borinquense]RYJ14106.1 ABC transporter ATP-binding pro